MTTRASLIGRLLLIPLALGSVCLSALFGTPMAQAMESAPQTMHAAAPADHATSFLKMEVRAERVDCCVALRAEHDTAATAPTQEKSTATSLVADLPHTAFPPRTVCLNSTALSPNDPSSRPQSFLTGTIIKRE